LLIGTVARIILDTDYTYIELVKSNSNLIVIGNQFVNLIAREIMNNKTIPVKFINNNDFIVDSCLFNSFNQGIMFTFPLDINNNSNNIRNRIGLMISADNKDSLYDVISYSYSSNTALTRAPFSNMQADFFITGGEFRAKAGPGLQGIGYWNNNWKIDEKNTWFSYDCI
jgi:hypothetical protein